MLICNEGRPSPHSPSEPARTSLGLLEETPVITERLTFRAKYGQGDALVALMKQSFDIMPSDDIAGARIYTDHTGPMFTVAMEIDHADLAAYAKSSMSDGSDYARSDFQQWFAKMVECTEMGERQLFNSEKLR
jgi:hypothetical protein